MNFIDGNIKSNKFVSKGFNCPLNIDLNDQEVIFGLRPDFVFVHQIVDLVFVEETL